MRDRAERFAVLPFSNGCASESSVALASADPKKPNPPVTSIHTLSLSLSVSVSVSVSFGSFIIFFFDFYKENKEKKDHHLERK
jgi:hypothetical protein